MNFEAARLPQLALWAAEHALAESFVLLGLGIALVLVVRGQRALALGWVLALAGNSMLNPALKLLPARWPLPALLAAVTVVVSVGASRVFLRVHFASDVLAGFASGTAWLALCITGMELVRWRRAGRC